MKLRLNEFKKKVVSNKELFQQLRMMFTCNIQNNFMQFFPPKLIILYATPYASFKSGTPLVLSKHHPHVFK